MNALAEIDAAIHALQEAGCFRDARTGFWLMADGTHLGNDPIEASQVLRQRMLHRAFTPANGERYLTR